MLYELLFLLWVESLLVDCHSLHGCLDAFASSGQCVSAHVVFFSNFCKQELFFFTVRFHLFNGCLNWFHIG
ncbi:hypothetical protein EJ02DRAFT_230480 [Clathrospora elynae]|uniref:Secreted protein n=1 Tax=Clathrospora elynae TaxID=706981 RepID=A0A6A5SLN2_9PLEO|nr:hypothetical protein EJ02DRAFT_230480 [Clathrospora elynae]